MIRLNYIKKTCIIHILYGGGLSEKRISRNSSENEIGIINSWKVSHIVIKININIKKVIFNNKIII